MAEKLAAERWSTLLGSAATFMISLELTVIAVALPSIAQHYQGVSKDTVSWVFTAYNVGVAAFLLVGGWLAERYGRLRVFRLALVAFGLGSLAAGWPHRSGFSLGPEPFRGSPGLS